MRFAPRRYALRHLYAGPNRSRCGRLSRSFRPGRRSAARCESGAQPFALRLRRPLRARIRFAETSGTRSATVPVAARARYFPPSAGRGRLVFALRKARLRLARKRKVSPDAQNSLKDEPHSGCLGFMSTEAGAGACPDPIRARPPGPHDDRSLCSRRPWNSASRMGLQIERAAIERDKNFCIRVFGYGALGYAVSFVSRRNYDPEILITALLEKKSDLRGRCNSVAVVIGNHHYFVSIRHVLCQQTGALGHAADAQVLGEVLEFSGNSEADRGCGFAE